MKVTLVIGNSAYAVIKTPAFCMDVMLSPGRSAQQSLRESAMAIRSQCADSLVRAERMEQAAAVLEAQQS